MIYSLIIVFSFLVVTQIGGGDNYARQKNHPGSQSSNQSASDNSANTSPVITPTPEKLDHNKLIRHDGWQLPDILSFSLEESRVLVNIAGIGAFKTRYVPTEQIVLTATRPLLMDTGLVEAETWRVSSMLKFETSDGQVFCYMMRSRRVAVDGTGKILGTAAMVVSLNFYDNDGDGVFETLEFASVQDVRPSIPCWVSANKEKCGIAQENAAECAVVNVERHLEVLLRFVAIPENNEDCVREILKKGIRPSRSFDGIPGSEPIVIASLGGIKPGIIDALFERHLSPVSDEVQRALINICRTGQSKLVERFIWFNVPIDRRAEFDNTPLMYATASGDTRTVELLLKKQADPNARSDWGVTPMMTAAENTAVLDMLKKYGARIDEADNRGWTALFIAIIKEQVDKVEWLLRNGADPNTKNLEGNTPLRFLGKLENTEKRQKIAEMLKSHGGKP